MNRKVILSIVTIAAIVLHVHALQKADIAMKRLPTSVERPFVLPASVLKVLSLEFRGLASDMLFLKSMIFIGGVNQRKETPRVKEWEWHWWLKILDTATELDPHFFDPYYYANAFLPWDAGMVRETNALLQKGSTYRDWDWMLPFFIGFNNFYFLQNNGEAAEHLMEASRRPGGTKTQASLAARLAFKGNRTETAILFLEEVANNTGVGSQKDHYEKRIQILRSILVLEKGIALYEKEYGNPPTQLDELVKKKILKNIPVEPFGGRFYMDKHGRILSSSREADLMPHLSPAQIKIHRK